MEVDSDWRGIQVKVFNSDKSLKKKNVKVHRIKSQDFEVSDLNEKSVRDKETNVKDNQVRNVHIKGNSGTRVNIINEILETLKIIDPVDPVTEITNRRRTQNQCEGVKKYTDGIGPLTCHVLHIFET